MHPQDNNPYDFIMNPGTPAPKNRVPLPGANSKNAFLFKIGFIVGGVIILMIILAIVVNLLSSGKSSTEEFRSLAQTQQEVLRISEEGNRDARAQSVKNAAKNINLSVTTQQLKTLDYLAARDVKMKDKELALKADAEATKKLEAANQTSTFDSVFLQIMRQTLETYGNELVTLYNSSSNSEAKKILKEDVEQTRLLLEQLPTSAVQTPGATTTAP